MTEALTRTRVLLPAADDWPAPPGAPGRAVRCAGCTHVLGVYEPAALWEVVLPGGERLLGPVRSVFSQERRGRKAVRVWTGYVASLRCDHCGQVWEPPSGLPAAPGADPPGAGGEG